VKIKTHIPGINTELHRGVLLMEIQMFSSVFL